MEHEDRSCTWPGCRVVAPTIDLGEGWFCLTHADDDFLPPVTCTGAPVGTCVRCEHSVATFTADGTPLHEGCRRAWFETRRPLRPTGAYARRRT